MHVELTRDTRLQVPAIDPRTDSLRVWNGKYRTLEPLRALRNLRVLVIATYPDDSLAMLESLEDLRYLRILHMPKVHDLSPLAHLQRLESIALETLPSWDSSGKLTVVESLEPLAALPALAHVTLCGVVPKGRSLAPLERCPSLRSARFSKHPEAEVERFYRTKAVSDEHAPEPPAASPS